MVEMREQFEKLPEIAEKIKRSRLNFSKSLNRYLISSMSDDDQFDCDFVNGALYAFQEQQKQLDLIKKLAVGLRNEFNLWADDTEAFDAIEAQIENLEAVLKTPTQIKDQAPQGATHYDIEGGKAVYYKVNN